MTELKNLIKYMYPCFDNAGIQFVVHSNWNVFEIIHIMSVRQT